MPEPRSEVHSVTGWKKLIAFVGAANYLLGKQRSALVHIPFVHLPKFLLAWIQS